MTLSRMIPLPESRAVLSAPPARFKSGRRAPGVSLNSRGLCLKTVHASGAGP